jgi:hypothetical protein
VRVEFDPHNGQKIVTLYDTAGECIDLEKPCVACSLEPPSA